MQFVSSQKTAIAWGLMALVTGLLIWLLAPVLTPFVVAAVLAYALTPLVDWIDSLARGLMPRLVAVLVVALVVDGQQNESSRISAIRFSTRPT